MKKKFDQRIIMRIEMVILIVITIIAITLAWFVIIRRSAVKGMELTAYNDEYLRVAVEQGGEDVDILTLSGNSVKADVQLPYFYNIYEKDSDKKQMAPGVYGQIDLYITAISPLVRQCTVSIESLPDYIDAVAQDEGKKAKTEALLNGHIQYYAVRDDNNKGTGYSRPVTVDDPLLVDLEKNVEKKVTIYWIWFYEYRDIPNKGRQYNADNYFEGTITGIYNPYVQEGSTQMEQYIREYDEGDTRIGLSVKNLSFRLYVDAVLGGWSEFLPGAGDGIEEEDVENATESEALEETPPKAEDLDKTASETETEETEETEQTEGTAESESLGRTAGEAQSESTGQNADEVEGEQLDKTEDADSEAGSESLGVQPSP